MKRFATLIYSMPTKISAVSKYHPLHQKRRTISVPFGASRFLAAIEGVEGGFAISASIVVALGLAGVDRHLLLVTAIVSIIVSGFNSASVKYSSEHYLDQLDGHEKRNKFRHYFLPALIEFVCYFVISVIVVIPLVLIHNLTVAICVSIVMTLFILYSAGYWRAYMLRMPRHRDAIETTLLGSGIIIVGIVSGMITKLLLIS